MMSAVYTIKPDALPVDLKEVFRYAGSPYDAELEGIVKECISETEGATAKAVCYGIFDIKAEDGVVDLGFCRVNSAALAKNLSGCSRAVLFAATVGIVYDRLIMKYSKISPVKAVMMQALGAERIEALCDAFCREIKTELRCELKPRFSAGYGDLPLELQRDIFRVLEPQKRIGLTLNDSLIMSPSKSVTALIGVLDK